VNGRFWSPDEVDLVMACYEFTPTRELAELTGRSMSSIYRLANLLDLHKSPECIAEQARVEMRRPDHGGRRCQFQKGIVPHNKGKKMPAGWAPGRMRETQFKKGERSGKAAEHWMAIGAKRKIEGYLYIKISDIPNVPYTVNWKPMHVRLWEDKRGPVPAGHVVVFKDGNRDRVKISNLQLISRADLMRRNTIHNLPEPLKELIRLNGAIKRTITMRRKKDAEEQNERPAQSPVRNARKAE